MQKNIYDLNIYIRTFWAHFQLHFYCTLLVGYVLQTASIPHLSRAALVKLCQDKQNKQETVSRIHHEEQHALFGVVVVFIIFVCF